MATIDIVHGRLDLPVVEVARLRTLLSMPEQARAERFVHARDRRRFIVRRARLRQWLGARIGMPPARLTFAVGEHGKPRLAGASLSFSLSHSGEHWLLAIGRVEVGADIECMRRGIDERDIARTLFAPAELAALDALPEPDASRAFFDVWARKEAFVKALGKGLSYPLDAFCVSAERTAALIAGGQGWDIARLDIAPDIAGAVVARADGAPLQVRMTAADATPAALVA